MKKALGLAVIALVWLVVPSAATGEEGTPAVPTTEEAGALVVPLPDFVGGQSQDLDFDDLFTPEPNYVCLTGWCSNNTQCVEWVGPDCICRKKSGATCGTCICP